MPDYCDDRILPLILTDRRGKGCGEFEMWVTFSWVEAILSFLDTNSYLVSCLDYIILFWLSPLSCDQTTPKPLLGPVQGKGRGWVALGAQAVAPQWTLWEISQDPSSSLYSLRRAKINQESYYHLRDSLFMFCGLFSSGFPLQTSIHICFLSFRNFMRVLVF